MLTLGIGVAIGSLTHLAPTPQDKTLTVRDFPDLVGGLKATPGCLDVQTTGLQGGKQVAIFAWFENKAAVQRWYASPMHQEAMKTFFPNRPGRTTILEKFKDTESPVLVVASVTPSDKPGIAGSPLAVSQIAIEMYTPVPGGVALGGGFAPQNLKVPGLVRMD